MFQILKHAQLSGHSTGGVENSNFRKDHQTFNFLKITISKGIITELKNF